MKTKILIIGSLIATLSFGAGFDCKRASTPTEKTICANKGLSLLDVAMSMQYRTNSNILEYYADEGESGAKILRAKLKTTQKEFVNKREVCQNNINCIYNITNQRISTLNKMVDNNKYECYKVPAGACSGLGGAASLQNNAKMEFAYANLHNAISQADKTKLANEQKKFKKSVEKMWDRLTSDGSCGTDRSICHEEESNMIEARTKALQARFKSIKK